ncbi:MAG: hypothetical protein EXX96DRAFT_472750, partial [Benjaminiella poitrasii]
KAMFASFIVTTPLSPIVALVYVMIKQESSLLSLEHRYDATVKMLYAIAKETLDHKIQNKEKTVEVLLNVWKIIQYNIKVYSKPWKETMIPNEHACTQMMTCFVPKHA